MSMYRREIRGSGSKNGTRVTTTYRQGSNKISRSTSTRYGNSTITHASNGDLISTNRRAGGWIETHVIKNHARKPKRQSKRQQKAEDRGLMIILMIVFGGLFGLFVIMGFIEFIKYGSVY